MKRDPVTGHKVKPLTIKQPSHARAWWPPDAPMVETPQTKYTTGPAPRVRVLRTNTHGTIG